jgi:hypothetical protein
MASNLLPVSLTVLGNLNRKIFYDASSHNFRTIELILIKFYTRIYIWVGSRVHAHPSLCPSTPAPPAVSCL